MNTRRSSLRTWAALLLIPAFVLIFCAGCEMEVERTFAKDFDYGDNNPNLALAIGDSITYGYELDNPNQAYPAQLAGMLGHRVINAGVSGDRSADCVARLGGLLARHKPGMVIILAGANDVIHGHDDDTTAGNLSRMIEMAKANKSLPVICTMTPAFRAHSFMTSSILDMNAKIRVMAEADGAVLADLFEAYGNNGDYLQHDGLHPNATGQHLIALTIYEQLQ